MTDETHIVVVGAGIIGLSTAITILKHDPSIVCTIVAADTPLDTKTSATWCSPWAGAMHGCNAMSGDVRAESESYLEFKRQYDAQETDSLRYTKQIDYWMHGGGAAPKLDELKPVFDDLRIIDSRDLPMGCKYGLEYTTLMRVASRESFAPDSDFRMLHRIDPTAYIQYLLRKFRDLGGKLVQARINALKDVFALPGLEKIAALVNCAGLGARALSDVADSGVTASRKQSCMVKAPWVTTGLHFEDSDGWFWTMPRSSGLVAIGGLIQDGDSDTVPRAKDTETMLRRALAADQTLLPLEKRLNGTWKDLDLVETKVGIHFKRAGGLRCELDKFGILGVPLVHNYAYPSGYECAWGFANKVVRILEHAL